VPRAASATSFSGNEERKLAPGKFASLHAKFAVADGRQAFVSSANLTGYAMDHNLEVGYLVTGGSTPQSLERHMDNLVGSGALVLAEDGIVPSSLA